MTASYTFDIFSSLDGYGSYSGGDWGGVDDAYRTSDDLIERDRAATIRRWLDMAPGCPAGASDNKGAGQ